MQTAAMWVNTRHYLSIAFLAQVSTDIMTVRFLVKLEIVGQPPLNNSVFGSKVGDAIAFYAAFCAQWVKPKITTKYRTITRHHRPTPANSGSARLNVPDNSIQHL